MNEFLGNKKFKKVNASCPSCGKKQTSRFGYSGEGKQRYLCNNRKCSKKTFISDYSYRACMRDVKSKLNKMINKNMTINQIAKKLEISANTVINSRKKQQGI